MRYDIRCIHRHTIDSHPACFAQGKVKWNFKDDREWERELGQPWWTFPGYKIGYLDIEADGLKANFSTMLSWALKEKGKKEVTTAVITKEELFEGTTDRRLVTSLIEEMKKYQILVTYYGTRYDIPYIRTKALYWDLEFPGFSARENPNGTYTTRPEIYHWDLYYVVRNKLCLSRNSLLTVTSYLGIDGKTPLPGSLWTRAKYGDPEALGEVLHHNIEDVRILEELHDRLDGFSKWTRKGI